MTEAITIFDLQGRSRKIYIDDDGRIVTSIGKMEGIVSTDNSTTDLLLANAKYYGEWELIKDAAIIKVGITSDVAAASMGLDFQQSPDKEIIFDELYELAAGDKKLFTPNPILKWFRIVYTNGTSDQGLFSLQTILSSVYSKPTSHRIGDSVTGNDDTELVKSVIAYRNEVDDTYNNVGVQNPFPVDGDTIYAKDIWLDQSDMGDFSGTITDLFDNLHSIIANTTSDNPKQILIHFSKTVISNAIGLGSFSGNFSNTLIQIGNSGGVFTTILDESTDDTKYTSRTFQLPVTAGFNAVKFFFYTADTVTLSNTVILKTKGVVARLQALSQLTNTIEDISSYREVLNVNNAWVHRKIVNETFHQHTGDTTTPSSAITEGDIAINFTSVAGFSVGSEIKLTEDSTQEIGLLTITDITALVVTIDRPIGNDYTTAAVIAEVTTNMAAVVGTLASPEIYEIDPPIGVVWQFTRILLSITDNLAPDDGKFGGMDALDNGVALRATTAAGRTIVFANWKTNGDMKLDMFNVEYTDKAPAGNHGVHGRWTFTTAEVVAELDGDASPIQKLEILIQDDLTDLITFTMRGQGRVFSP